MSGNPMDEEKGSISVMPKFKNCDSNYPYGSSFMMRMSGISSGSNSVSKVIQEKHWRLYLNKALEVFKVHHTFDNISKFTQEGKLKTEAVPEMVPFNDNFEGIYSQIKMAFESQRNTFLLLTGPKGCGRSAAVYYAMNKYYEDDFNLKNTELEPRSGLEPLRERSNNTNKKTDNFVSKPNDKQRPAGNPNGPLKIDQTRQKIAFLEVDAQIYYQDTKINNYILAKLENFCTVNGIQELDFDHGSANNFQQLINYMKQLRLVIYIKNIEVFTEETRQVYLYSLLDCLNSYCPKVVMIFSTADIFFLTKLEKRVKSRFSYKNFQFEDFQVQPHLVDILKKRMQGSGRQTVEEREIQECVVNWGLQDPQVLKTLNYCRAIGKHLDFFIELFKYTFLFIDPAEITIAKDLGPKKFGEFFHRHIKEANKMIGDETNPSEVLNSLPKPARLIIMGLHYFNSLRTNTSDFKILFSRLKPKLSEVIDQKFSFETSRKSWKGFSDTVLKDNLVLLKKMNYIFLDRTPISSETEIQLQDIVSPTFITAKTNEYDIYFE